MGLLLILMGVLILGTLLYALGVYAVKFIDVLPGLLSKFGAGLERGDAVSWLTTVALAVCFLILLVSWLQSRPTGMQRRGHWEYRGEDKHWVPDDDR